MEQSVILLVEDNPDDEALTLRALKKRDLSVMPQVIFLDLKLPKMDGFEVLEPIRSTQATQYLPVVILTTSSEDQDRFRGYDLGAHSFVRRP